MTGIVTALGIECGRALAGLRGRDVPARSPGSPIGHRARLLATLLLAFVGGGIAGTLGVLHAGRLALLPAASTLALVALVPAFDDFTKRRGVSGDLDARGTPPEDAPTG